MDRLHLLVSLLACALLLVAAGRAGFRVAVSATRAGRQLFLIVVAALQAAAFFAADLLALDGVEGMVLVLAGLVALGGFIYGVTRGWRTPVARLTGPVLLGHVAVLATVWAVLRGALHLGPAESAALTLLVPATLALLSPAV